MKIFIGTEEIIGYFSNLTRGFKERGIDVYQFFLEKHPFEYEEEKLSILESCFRRMYSNYIFYKRSGNGLKGMFFKFLSFPFYIGIFLKALRCDVFIFGFGRSFFGTGKDLWLLKKLGKKIISVVWFGSEARPPYIDGSYQTEKLPNIEYIYNLTKFIKKRCERIEKYSDVVIAYPPCSHFFTKRAINGFSIGIPFIPTKKDEDIIPNGKKWKSIKNKNIIKILHAPSHPVLKGTEKIRKAIHKIKEKYKEKYIIEYIEITQKPHKEVLKAIEECDFAIDQVYSDTPLGGFATEVAWHKKPVIVAGYELDLNKKFTKNFPPSYICKPDEIEYAIEDLLLNENKRKEIGEALFNFVSQNWSLEKIVDKYIKIIEGNIPDELVFDPKDVKYIYGCGYSEEKLKKLLREYIGRYGVEGLFLSHRPDLEKEFLDFIK